MKKSILFITCDEAHHICDKNQYGEATAWERVKFGIRLSWCKITRAYTKRNNKLTEAMQSSKVDCLKDDELQKLEQQFKKELAKQK